MSAVQELAQSQLTRIQAQGLATEVSPVDDELSRRPVGCRKRAQGTSTGGAPQAKVCAPSVSYNFQMSPSKNRVFNTTAEEYMSTGIVGEGATSLVYRVLDSGGNVWALKCLRSAQASTTRIKRFLNELRFCAGTAHKNIVRVQDDGYVAEDGKKCPFYVMPLYASTLRQEMNKGLSTPRILPLFSQVLNGLEAAHLQGVWHRDQKPENLLYDPATDTVVVSDFGIARFVEDQMHTTVETKSNERLANFRYAAPEQLRPGDTVDQRTDIFALGLILYELFMRRVPRGAGFPKIGSVAPAYAYLDGIVEQMIQDSASNRPGCIDDVKRMLLAAKTDFIERQKLDEFRRTVVPASAIVDPLVTDPPSVRDVDIFADTMLITLSQPVNGAWIKAFKSIGSHSSMPGGGPQFWDFRGTEARAKIRPHILDGHAQRILDHFKSYVNSANVGYRAEVEAAARAREEADRAALERRIQEEERRIRIRSSLRI